MKVHFPCMVHENFILPHCSVASANTISADSVGVRWRDRRHSQQSVGLFNFLYRLIYYSVDLYQIIKVHAFMV